MHTWTLSPEAERRFISGHPWVFSNELAHRPMSIHAGEEVQLVNHRGEFLAWGYGNPHSLIAFRALSRTQKDSLDFKRWIIDRLLDAAAYRYQMGLLEYSHRLCFSEADSLPGLIIDCFVLEGGKSQAFVLQTLTAGMERLLDDPMTVIHEYLKKASEKGFSLRSWEETAIILKRDSSVRKLEGLSIEEPKVLKDLNEKDLAKTKVWIRGASFLNPSPLTFEVDLIGGQKTGFFLDQGGNVSLLLSHLPSFKNKDVRILDLFSYVGQWGGQLARFLKGSSKSIEVWCVDASEKALSLAKANVEKEGASVKTICADIFEGMSDLPKDFFDIVICDPPALIRSKKDVASGKKGYVKINSVALKCVKAGGIFATSSCSYHLSDADFSQVLKEARQKTGREVLWIAKGTQSPDHPILMEFPEGTYLKFRLGWVRISDVTGVTVR